MARSKYSDNYEAPGTITPRLPVTRSLTKSVLNPLPAAKIIAKKYTGFNRTLSRERYVITPFTKEFIPGLPPTPPGGGGGGTGGGGTGGGGTGPGGTTPGTIGGLFGGGGVSGSESGTAAGFSLSSIPSWAWIGLAALVGLYVLKGTKGGKGFKL